MRASELQTGTVIELSGLSVPNPYAISDPDGPVGEILRVRRGTKYTYATIGNFSIVKIPNSAEVTVVEKLLSFEMILTRNGTDGSGSNRDSMIVHARSRDAAFARASKIVARPGMWKNWSFTLAS